MRSSHAIIVWLNINRTNVDKSCICPAHETARLLMIYTVTPVTWQRQCFYLRRNNVNAFTLLLYRIILLFESIALAASAWLSSLNEASHYEIFHLSQSHLMLYTIHCDGLLYLALSIDTVALDKHSESQPCFPVPATNSERRTLWWFVAMLLCQAKTPSVLPQRRHSPRASDDPSKAKNACLLAWRQSKHNWRCLEWSYKYNQMWQLLILTFCVCQQGCTDIIKRYRSTEVQNEARVESVDTWAAVRSKRQQKRTVPTHTVREDTRMLGKLSGQHDESRIAVVETWTTRRSRIAVVETFAYQLHSDCTNRWSKRR